MIILKSKPRLYVHASKIEEISRLEAQAKALEVIFEKELNLLNLKPGIQVLDAGCGTGAKSRKIALRVKPGQVFGIDLDPVFIKHAKEFAQNKGIKNIRFEVGNIDDLRFNDALFDLTYCSLVLMHVYNPVNTLIELKRVTKPGGYVTVSDNDDGGIIAFPNSPKFFTLWNKYGELAKNRGEDRHIGRQLFSLMSQAGFHSIKIYPLPLHATQENPSMLQMLVSVPLQILQQEREEMIQVGLATAQDFEEAIKEVQLTLKNPGAFIMGITFFSIGRVI